MSEQHYTPEQYEYIEAVGGNAHAHVKAIEIIGRLSRELGEAEYRLYRAEKTLISGEALREGMPVKIAMLEAEVERLRLALRLACTPPWPVWDMPQQSSIDTLVAFHLRRAAQAAGGKE